MSDAPELPGKAPERQGPNRVDRLLVVRESILCGSCRSAAEADSATTATILAEMEAPE